VVVTDHGEEDHQIAKTLKVTGAVIESALFTAREFWLRVARCLSFRNRNRCSNSHFLC
jgi:hypothetical protein